MDIADLHLVRTILETGSLSATATHMGQSQPTLSRRLLRLEDQLQTKLFHRSPRGLSPTPLAHYIAAQADPIDRQLSTIKRHVELVTQLDHGTIRVGVGPIIAHLMMPYVLGQFIDTTGGAEISIVTEDDLSLLDLFGASELDVIIGPFATDYATDRNYVVKPMIGDRIIAVARPNHPVFDLDAPSLSQFPMAIPKTQGSLTQSGPEEVLGPARISVDNYALLKKMTMDRDLICGGPKAIFRDEIKAKTLKVVPVNLGLDWQSVLFVRPESLASPLLAHFVDLCETVSSNWT